MEFYLSNSRFYMTKIIADGDQATREVITSADKVLV